MEQKVKITDKQIEKIKHLLQTDQSKLEWSIRLIYAYQTAEEQNCHNTIEHNGIGFTGADAPTMTYMANWLVKGNHLSGRFLAKAKDRMPKYAKQIIKIILMRKAGEPGWPGAVSVKRLEKKGITQQYVILFHGKINSEPMSKEKAEKQADFLNGIGDYGRYGPYKVAEIDAIAKDGWRNKNEQN